MREASSDCSRFRRVLDVQTAYFLEQTTNWETQKVAALMRGHIKRGWMKDLPPLPLSREEEEVFSAYEWPVLTPDAVARTKVVWDLMRRNFKIDKRELRRQVKSSMDRALGKGVTLTGVLRYATAVGDATVFTDIDYPTKGGGQLRYGQSVLLGWPGFETGTFDNKILLSRASLFDLLGGPQTQWSCMTDADVPAAVEALSDLCLEFLQELPKILDVARG